MMAGARELRVRRTGSGLAAHKGYEEGTLFSTEMDGSISKAFGSDEAAGIA
jgi:hypothetical protein